MNVWNKHGLGLARLGLHTRVRVNRPRVRVRATHTMTK